MMSDYQVRSCPAPNFAYDLCVDKVTAAHKERILELQALFRIATILSKPGDLSDNAAEMLNVLIESIGADRALLRRLDSTGSKLSLLAASGPLVADHPPADHPPGDDPPAAVIAPMTDR